MIDDVSMMLGSDEVKVCICARSSFTGVLLDALTGTGSGTQRQRVAPALAPAWRAGARTRLLCGLCLLLGCRYNHSH